MSVSSTGPASWLPTAPLHQLPDVISDSKGPNLSSSFPTQQLCLILSVKLHTLTGDTVSSVHFDFHLLHTESVPNTTSGHLSPDVSFSDLSESWFQSHYSQEWAKLNLPYKKRNFKNVNQKLQSMENFPLFHPACIIPAIATYVAPVASRATVSLAWTHVLCQAPDLTFLNMCYSC